jgi:hypothetical protein
MPAGTGISYTTLVTNNGFTQGTVGAGLSGGTTYTKAVGSMSVQVTLYTEQEPGGQTVTNATTYTGVVYVLVNGDTSAADQASVAALLASIGLANFKIWPNTNVQLTGINVNGAVAAYSQSF